MGAVLLPWLSSHNSFRGDTLRFPRRFSRAGGRCSSARLADKAPHSQPRLDRRFGSSLELAPARLPPPPIFPSDDLGDRIR